MNTTGRRSNQVRGWVDFPINSPEYENSGEGGMFVRLVVVPHFYENKNEDFDKYLEKKYQEEWMVCCGGAVVVIYDESFLGDDVNPDQAEENRWVEPAPAEFFHFPRFDDRKIPAEERQTQWLDPYTSIGYLCAMTIGSTGRSGWNEKEGCSWRCTFEDLTEEGKNQESGPGT